MTYPDGEVVTYHYNAAGQVESMMSNKQGRQSVIVDRIGYDKCTLSNKSAQLQI